VTAVRGLMVMIVSVLMAACAALAEDTTNERAKPLLEAAGSVQQDGLFVGGKGGYNTYRIPALIVSKRGTVLAFCEGRKEGPGDAGLIHALLRRSFDNGKTWANSQIVVQQDGMTCGNPCPIVDRTTGTIFLWFCKNPKSKGTTEDVAVFSRRTVWLTRSSDDGATWSVPEDLTAAVKKPNWTWYATGPGHGIQLASGRLIAPCCHTVRVNLKPDDPEFSHVIYSDDHGKTWHLGGEVGPGGDESMAVETFDGSLYLNCRNGKEPGHRAFARSRDGGLSFGPRQVEKALPEPPIWGGCQASLVRFDLGGQPARRGILFSNPVLADPKAVRMKMTVRVSYDDCKTWSAGKVLYPGPAAYSDLTVAPDGTILCLYERGLKFFCDNLTLARFKIEWLTAAGDEH
jgi:sialidase-1